MNIIGKIREAGVIPVIKIEDVGQALPLAQALCRGGLPVLEVTFRTSSAQAAIERIVKACPGATVGAGTVLSEEQVVRAADSGAAFVVSPGSNPRVIERALKAGLAVFPGVVTPTEVENALSFGLKVLKFFPAESFGGVKTLKSLSAPYASVEWMPTGGINGANLAEYLSFSRVIACGASCMVKEELLRAGDYAQIERLASEIAAVRDSVRKKL